MSIVCPIPEGLIKIQVLDKQIDVLAASVDGICVFFDMRKLETVNKNVYTNFLRQRTGHVDEATHMYRYMKDLRVEVLRLEQLEIASGPVSLLYSATGEIKNVTNENTRERAGKSIEDVNRESITESNKHMKCINENRETKYTKRLLLLNTAYRFVTMFHYWVSPMTCTSRIMSLVPFTVLSCVIRWRCC